MNDIINTIKVYLEFAIIVIIASTTTMVCIAIGILILKKVF
jgi:hypothetical protein